MFSMSSASDLLHTCMCEMVEMPVLLNTDRVTAWAKLLKRPKLISIFAVTISSVFQMMRKRRYMKHRTQEPGTPSV